ncbi:MAG: hypothetical protein Q9166_003057 [cf. Caloplaca sp. 2 TL-2023]
MEHWEQYLTRQGWRGSGHALQPDGQGITKPLLISKKSNVLGVGRKVHDVHADQWWSRAFDKILRRLIDQAATQKVIKTTATHFTQSDILPTRWAGNGGLYGNFVRGEDLKGTMGEMGDIERSKVDAGCATKRQSSSRRERNPRTSKNRPCQSNSKQLPSGEPDKPIASALMTEVSRNVDPQKQSVSSRDVSQPGMVENDEKCVVERRVISNASADFSPLSVAERGLGKRKYGPNIMGSGDMETVPQGDRTVERHSKRKKRRPEGDGLKEKAAYDDQEPKEASARQAKKKKKKKRRGKYESL